VCYHSGVWDKSEPRVVEAGDAKAGAEKVCRGPLVEGESKPGLLRRRFGYLRGLQGTRRRTRVPQAAKDLATLLENAGYRKASLPTSGTREEDAQLRLVQQRFVDAAED
jgi:hypothetical protein